MRNFVYREKKMKDIPIFKEFRRNVAGIDLAWRAENYVCGPRLENGECEIAAFGTATPELHRMLQWLQERSVESVAMESTSVYWIPATDLLEANGIEVVLVDAREVRMVPGRKSDIQDCQWLQKLHSCGLLRGAFRPPEAVSAVRSVIREKDNLTAMRTQSIQQMQKSLDQMNIRVHHAVSDIDGKTGTDIVRAIVEGERNPARLAALRDKRCKKSEREIAEHLTGTWREEHLFNLGQAFKTLQFLDERIAEYDLKVAQMFASLAGSIIMPDDISDGTSDNPPPPLPNKKLTAKERSNIADRANVERFMGFDMTLIPGIGYGTAKIIASELGQTFSRFPSERHFASYIGLAPSLGKSAGKNVRHKKCKNTSRAGQALRMAASTLNRSQTELGAFYRSVARRTDKKTAVKATARRMAHMIYRGVVYGKEFVDRGAEAYEARLRERTVRTVNKLIKSFNINNSEIAKALVTV
jgi:transposase